MGYDYEANVQEGKIKGKRTLINSLNKSIKAKRVDTEETDEKFKVFGQKIIDPIEIFGLDSFGDSALIIKARLKTKPIAQWEVGREYRRRLKIAFDKNNIEIPFPHTTVYWGEEISPLQLNMGESGKSK